MQKHFQIWLFDIIDVVPEPGQPLTKNRIKMVYNKDQKGPITAITHVVGFLVSAVGQKVRYLTYDIMAYRQAKKQQYLM